jgi:hypothetical protein
MTAGAGAGSPDGRSLARWHAQLAPLRPQSLWVGTLDLGHLDAPVRVRRLAPLDPLDRHLLAALPAAGATAAALEAKLRLGPALGRWLGELCAAGLVRRDGDRFVLTPHGGQALAAGAGTRLASERRRFSFVLPGPHYVPWLVPPGPHDPALDVADARWVADSVARPAEWKRRVGFPEDVEAVELPAADLRPAAAWGRVAVARSERVPVVLAVTESGAVAGFVPDAGGRLTVDAPAVRLAERWDEPFPELAAGASEPVEDVGDGWRLVGAGRLRRAVTAG